MGLLTLLRCAMTRGDVPKPPPPQPPMPPPPPPMGVDTRLAAAVLRSRDDTQHDLIQAELRQHRATRNALVARYGARQGVIGLRGGDAPDPDPLGLLAPPRAVWRVSAITFDHDDG